MMTRGLTLLLAGSSSLVATPLLAQSNPGSSSITAPSAAIATASEDSDSLADIVVTARRRAEPLQQTPLSVSAIAPQRLAEAHVTNLGDIATLSPALNLSRNASNPTSLFAFLRGFGTKSSDPSSEPAVALTIDGIYQGAVIGSLVNLFDVEAVEVLRGPQGTLLGKNAPAGGISIRTRRPKSEFNGLVQVDYGRFGDFQIRTFVDAPLAGDKLAGTISYFRQRSDGYVRNIVTGRDVGGLFTQSFRVGLLATPSDTISWYVTSQYDIDKGEETGVRNVSDFTPLVIPTANYAASPPVASTTCRNAFSIALCRSGALPNLDRYTTQALNMPRRNNRGFSVTSDLAVDAGPVAFAAVTGFRKFKERVFPDIDGTQLPIIDSHYVGNFRQFSQELRVASGDGGGLDLGGKLNWLLGAYYFYFDYDRLNDQISLGVPAPTFQDGQTNSFAVFAHAEYKLTDKLTLSGGARQTWDRKSHTSKSANFFRGLDTQVVQRASWDNLSLDGTLQYQFTSDKMVFVRYAEGYRGGGFTGTPSNASLAARFEPETVTSYEFGSKTDFFNKRLRINVSLFYNEYSNLQRTITTAVPFPPFFAQLPRNIAAAKTKGIEIESQIRPIHPLTIRASVGYIDAYYTRFRANLTGVAENGDTDNSALHFPYTSKWTASAGATYVAELGDAGKLAFVADYTYRSSYNTTDLNYAFARQSGVGLLSSTIIYTDPSDRYTLSVYGRNLTNRGYIDNGDPVGGLTTFVGDAPPRTWGVSAGMKF